jgi:hypothetical protein
MTLDGSLNLLDMALRWRQVCLKSACIDLHRVKRGHDAKHPLRGPQLPLLRELQRTAPNSPYVFVSERKAPLSPRSIRQSVPHPHQLQQRPRS